MEHFERVPANLSDGQKELIDAYVENHPSLFDNRSHFIRCALNRQFRYLRSVGRFSTQKEVLENE